MSTKSLESSSLKDPSKLSFESPRVRRLILGSYWAVIFIAFPFWWYTTSIERLSLPTSHVFSLSEKQLRFPLHLQLYTEGYADAAVLSTDWQRTLNHKTSLEDRWDGLDIYLNPKADADPAKNPWTYTIELGGTETSVQDRHLFLTSQDSSSLPIHILSPLLAPYSAPADTQDRVVQYAPRYRLAFTLLNEDAAAGQAVHQWDIRNAISHNLVPILKKLSALYNFTIESQVQFHAPLAFKPQHIQMDDGDAYGITSEDLTVFVNSAEWTLSSSISNDPVLHFVLFVPSATQRPLYILGADDVPSKSTAFLHPQWGGIVLFNPPPLADPQSHIHLSSQDLSPVMHAFTSQLLALLGVPPLPPTVRSTQPDSALTDWQLDALLRRRIRENVQKSTETLRSIVRLVAQIENMPVGADVRGDVLDALSALDKVYTSSSNSTTQSLLHSAQALTLSSRAFFNPGMLALLYFPAEHKYAVYTPLFASVAVPLIAAVGREIIAWRRHRKEKTKDQNAGDTGDADKRTEREKVE